MTGAPANPRVSVAVCTYNGEKFVAEQMRSILTQTLLPGEVVVSDDGSTDRSVEIVLDTVKAWQSANPAARVDLHVLRNEAPSGVTKNFEKALMACRGDLIALCDQDDVWHPDRLESSVAVFDGRPDVLLLHSDAQLIDDGGHPTGEYLLSALGVSTAEIEAVRSGRALDVLLRRNIVTGATTMVRKELVQRARPFPAAWVHDEWLGAVAASTGRLEIVERPLIGYRQHSGNQIGAGRVTLAGKLERVRTGRTARNARLLERARVLRDRSASFDPVPDSETLGKIQGKLAHEMMRSGLPEPRLARMRPVVAAWLSRSYNRYGLGVQDVVRDLLQPV